MTRVIASVAAVALLAGGASNARAQSIAPAAPHAEMRSEFWREVAEPRYRRSRTLLRHATAYLRRYDEQRGEGRESAQRRALLEAAIYRLELALQITPDDPEVLHSLANAKMSWVRRSPAGAEERRDDEAAELFERVRALDPDYESRDVAFSLGVIHTRAHRFEDAAREYERSIGQEYVVDTSIEALGNLAEVTMLAGDVADAARHYERAVEIARRGHLPPIQANNQFYPATALPLWGLAIALDRLGEHRAALDRAREAVRASNGGTELLESERVFFEPPYELYWYLALAEEVRAETGTEAERRAHLERAAAQWAAFLEQSDGESRWEDTARRNLEAIRAQLPRR